MRWVAGTLPLLAVLTFAAVPSRPRIDPAGVPVELLLCGSGDQSAALDRFLETAGGAKARLVVLTSGAEGVSGPLGGRAKKVGAKIEVRPWRVAADGTFTPLGDVTGVWLAGKMDRVPPMFRKALESVRIVAASEPTADLLPDAMFGGEQPGAYQVGYELGDRAALNVQGRTLRVVGNGKITIRINGTKTQKPRELVLTGKQEEDLTALRRSARDRAEEFPPARLGVPTVDKGTLIIVGGGGMPKGLIERFVEMAGGKEAKIVVLPTAMPDPLPKRDGIAELFRKAGAKVTILPARDRVGVESKESIAALREATGIWFGGGRQWRFVDAYEDTAVLPLMFDVLKRGGVIGGSSAGATIQGEYLARGGVFDNLAIRYEGYERGLNFLPGVAIDQHFAQRKRFKDMETLMRTFPQYLGIGLDEATAIIVRGSVAKVTGRGQVHFYDAAVTGPVSLSEGATYNLKTRQQVMP